MKFFVSSVAFPGASVSELTELGKEHQFAIEFSSSMPPENGLAATFRESSIERIPHNYFPPPIEPFVLNLGSSDAAIAEKSLDHTLQGLELARASGAPFYSVHAGFCLDPRPGELGKPFSTIAERLDIHAHWDIFTRNVRLALKAADALKVDLLIENNVVIAENVLPDGTVPLLCATPESCCRLMSQLNHPRLGILLDTGHLQVTANTLGFDKNRAVRILAAYIRAIHHSDNDGIRDSNEPITDAYWFLRQMQKFPHIAHVLEVKNQRPEQVKGQLRLLQKALRPL